MRRKYRGPASPDLGEALAELLSRMGGSPQKALFARLWQNWESIVGAESASLIQPLGADGRHLLAGVEDALAMQEAQYQKEEIRLLVNAWLGDEYFEDVRISLMLGRETKNIRQPPPQPAALNASAPLARGASGVFLKGMDPNSAVAKAYALYAGKLPRAK